METQDQLFKEWNDEQRAMQAMADLAAWYQTPRKDITELADSHPDAFELYKARLDEHLENEGRKGEHYFITRRYEHERTSQVNKFLKSGKWRIADIASPIGCSSTEVDGSGQRNAYLEAHWWAIVERV